MEFLNIFFIDTLVSVSAESGLKITGVCVRGFEWVSKHNGFRHLG